MPIAAEAIPGLVSQMWQNRLNEMLHLDKLRRYARGEAGGPDLPEGTSDDIKALSRIAIKNVIGLVVDSFNQNLSVVGFRDADAKDNAAAWSLWQRNRMDDRQSEVHRSALVYGTGYVVVSPGDRHPRFRARTPRQIWTLYADPHADEFPLCAMETWVDYTTGTPRMRGLFMDDGYFYPIDLGAVLSTGIALPLHVTSVGDPKQHGAGVCPVVRFVNERDAEDLVRGEVEPLIVLQKAINAVNLDRLIVSRFGAFPQKVISGWTAGRSEVLAASASRVWTFEDESVKATALPAASVEPYNSLITEMMEHVAMVAQISPSQVTGKMVNLSAEALAAGEANQQRKIKGKRDSFGESWEAVLRLGARIDGDAETADDDNAEVVWRDTEARSFGAVVDGVGKLAAQGIPIDEMLTLIPGLSQQQISSIKGRVGSMAEVRSILEARAGGDG